MRSAEKTGNKTLDSYGDIRATLWHNITTKQPTASWPEVRQRILLENQYAEALVEGLHPELRDFPDWRSSTLSATEALESELPPNEEQDLMSKLNPEERQRMRKLLGLD